MLQSLSVPVTETDLAAETGAVQHPDEVCGSLNNVDRALRTPGAVGRRRDREIERERA